MKRLIVLVTACLAFAGFSMTYDEAYAFVKDKNIDAEMTAENFQTFLDAQLVLTNGNSINVAFKKKFITAEEACTLWDRIPTRFRGQLHVVRASSNATLRAAFVDKLCNHLKTSTDLREQYADAHHIYLTRLLAVNEDEVLEIAQKAVATGKLGFIGQVVYGSLPFANGKIGGTAKYGNKVTFTEKYAEFAIQQLEPIASAWFDTEILPTLNDQFIQGISIAATKIILDGELTPRYVSKVKALNAAYKGKRSAMYTYVNKNAAWANELNAQVLNEEGFFDIDYKHAAKRYEKVNGSKAAFEKTYNWIKSESMKLEFALHLSDIDKLIDLLKVCSDAFTVEEINSVIAPLNSINAGYRTNDLRLALMNINKKYTLKLYDDRDTWEPVISKVRAMIDAL